MATDKYYRRRLAALKQQYDDALPAGYEAYFPIGRKAILYRPCFWMESEKCTQIYLSYDYRFIMETSDFELFRDLGFQRDGDHVTVQINKRFIRLHRLIRECPEKQFVIHLNGNAHDFRRTNLGISKTSYVD